MVNSNALGYATKVWLASVLLAPALFIGFIGMYDGFEDITSTIGGYFMFVVYGMIFSIPCWLIFMFIVNKISKTESTIQNKKVFINISALVIGVGIFVLIFQNIAAMAFALPYVIALTGAIWYFELNIHSDTSRPTVINHLIE